MNPFTDELYANQFVVEPISGLTLSYQDHVFFSYYIENDQLFEGLPSNILVPLIVHFRKSSFSST